MRNYSIFENADFNLATTPDKPLVLISANNGGGKTSTLFAFRLALHGRRAHDIPLSDREYLTNMLSKFHNGDFANPCVIELDFDYLDLSVTRSVRIKREWRATAKAINEHLSVSVDDQELASIEAEDLLSSIVPPEVARYFFFDAERIKELADWDLDDEAQLFDAVNDLLGITLLEQLNRDLHKIHSTKTASVVTEHSILQQLQDVIESELIQRNELKDERALARRFRGRYDRALATIRRLGGILAEELVAKRNSLASAQAERAALIDEVHRAAHDILPLLCGRTLKGTLGAELTRRRTLDNKEVVKEFLQDNRQAIDTQLKAKSIASPARRDILEIFDALLRVKPTAVATALPNLSRSEEAWMQRVVERDLPALESRMRSVALRLMELEGTIKNIESAIKSTPDGDPKGEAALRELEDAQRDLIAHETRIANLGHTHQNTQNILGALQKSERLSRVAAFQSRRHVIRLRMLENAIAAIPELQATLQESKERRFSQFLLAALQSLWNKQRLVAITVDFRQRLVELRSSDGNINKRDLSSGEKQLFATAFIYSLAKLSGKHMPFVIDTPLGRLDQGHRKRFVTGFIPEASHQTILLSTDTEIVGSLYTDLEGFIAHRYDLADYNGNATEPVRLSLA